MKRKINIGFLGFGRQASSVHARFIARRRQRDCKIVAIYDVLPGNLTKAACQALDLGIDVTPAAIKSGDPCDPTNTNSVEEMISSYPNLDAVIVSTPHAKHYYQTKFCLSNRIHVLSDKPMALDSRQAHELTDLAKKNNLFYIIASQRRYERAYLYAKHVVENGVLGKVLCVDAIISQPGDWISDSVSKPSWRSNFTLSGGGAVFDLGWHLLDILCFLFEIDVKKVYATFEDQPLYKLEKQCSALIETKDGIKITLNINHLAPHNSVYERLHISGTEGLLILERRKPVRDMEQPTLLHQTKEGVIVRNDTVEGGARKWAPCKVFLDSIVSDQTPGSCTEIKSSGYKSLKTIKLIESLYESARRKEFLARIL